MCEIKMKLLVFLKVIWTSSVVFSLPEYNEEILDTDQTYPHIYTNKWVVHIEDGPDMAQQIVESNGFIFHGPLGSLPHLYHVEHKDVSQRSRRSADDHHSLLVKHPKVLWTQQQKVKSRQKRGYFSDPLFRNQWYLKNNGQTFDRCRSYDGYEKLDINVFPCWNSNITGEGVVVSILDDGLEHTHKDLKKNYDKKASYDYNSNDKDPFPRYESTNINKHGTRCAGEVAGEANNGICGVGVAYNAKVGGIRMLDGEVTDAVEAGSLSYAPDHIDIYSSSWGPDDDGKTVDGPGPLAKTAFADGVRYGRKGLGSIFVWATGNGGRNQDYCSCDGYINSPYTVSIGAVDNCGRKPWYAEPCPSTFAVTYSSGEMSGKRDKQISTTDLHGGCTNAHTGTSAAAPLAAGIFALVLQANPKLSWRDLQHLIVKTSKMVSPGDPSWQTNGGGHKVNSKFGFGALDAGDLVKMASSKDWKTAQPQHTCKTSVSNTHLKLKPGGTVSTSITDNACAKSENCVTKLEHVHVVITLEKPTQRGQLEITLTSPSNTHSAILRRRARDTSHEGFKHWAFLTVFNWDEDPKGKWTLTVTDYSNSGGKLVSWYLKFYGTCSMREMFNVEINETEICDDKCKRGCPNVFSSICMDCAQYCDCTVGECVPTCADHLVTDNELRHCKRTTDNLNYRYIPHSNRDWKSKSKHQSMMGLSLTAKFSIIGLSLVVVSVLIGGIAYFASKMPPNKNLPRGYQSVSRYPCSDVTVEGDETEEVLEAPVNTVNS
ncbi:neuroendocrine convertase 1-like [Hydractinia symbiolongicarpus]|uniref:neuroendocrine convertase 1-like n=1 Tax=Hydractinia symbiolongicarpus TaxID=13093 RepID=UPI00254E3454|nr:neuroendocrine convertase 1-like [Hydractinia symbiolongicarpus]